MESEKGRPKRSHKKMMPMLRSQAKLPLETQYIAAKKKWGKGVTKIVQFVVVVVVLVVAVAIRHNTVVVLVVAVAIRHKQKLEKVPQQMMLPYRECCKRTTT